MNNKPKIFCFFFLVLCSTLVSQNQNKKWYFGAFAGLDFMTTPPTILTNGALSTIEGCASMADGAGNILFYCDGVNVYNNTHVLMSNGTGLLGNNSACQACIILKKPGSSTLYYIFTVAGVSGPAGLNYSIVDMSLSAGQGSVTVKNSPLYAAGCYEKLTGTLHCNGSDYWILSHDISSSVFRAHLLTSAGVNTAAVTSTLGTAIGLPYSLGCMKISPNGKKLGMTEYMGNVDLFDFDNSTGIVSNSLTIGTSYSSYGCEFSPDGTKFYAGSFGGSTIRQWDLCAGSNTAIIASQYTITAVSPWSMQIGTDGKIYVARQTSTLGTISNPNVGGSGCNYADNGQSIFPKTTSRSLPNYIGSSFVSTPTVAPFTYTVNNAFGCQTASYTAPPVAQNFSMIGCASVGYSVTGIQWRFNDPISGPANTSTLTNPSHYYQSLGTYTTQLIIYYSCTGANDTLTQIVNINQPCISVSSTSITCANLGSATVQATGGVGPFSYTWTPTNQTNSVAVGLSPGTYTIRVFDAGINLTYTATTVFTSLIPLTGTLSKTSSLTCYAASNGTAMVTGMAGGSGNQNYWWSNGTYTYTAPNPLNLSAGNWSMVVTDALTGCTINNTFTITQPPTFSIAITASSPTFCAGTSVALTGTASGGTPITPGAGYNYTWTSGPVAFTYSPTETVSGAHIYTLLASDAYSCQTSQTISVNVVSNPVLVVANVSVCPFETGTLSVSGASSYTWNPLNTGSTFTASPLNTTQYTVVGAALGCTSAATASIVLKPVPVPTITTNGPLCEGYLYQMNSGATTTLSIASYSWNGPAAYTAAIQNTTINPIGLSNAGVYILTVTAVNGCTAAVNYSLIVFPTPALSASGSTVCVGGVFNLTSNSGVGTTYQWSGPLGFSSTQQNVIVPNAITGQSGSYTIAITGFNGCVNSTSVSVSVLSPPLLGMSFSSFTTCAQGFNGSPSAISVNHMGANTYTLSTPPYIGNNNPFGTSSGITLLPPYLNTGPATITLTGSNGYCSSNISATVAFVPNPTVVLNNPTPSICTGQTFTYISSGATSYVWASLNPTIMLNVAGNRAIANTTTSALFSVFGNSLGCNSATENATLTVNPLPQFSLNPVAPVTCLGEPIILSANGTGTSYTWSPPFFLSSVNGATVSANPNTQQTYVVVAGLNNCTLSAATTVSVLPVPSPSIIAPRTSICANDSVVMYGYGGLSYSWAGPNGTTGRDPSLGFNGFSSSFTGIYTLTAMGANNCKATATQAITVYELPQGYLTSANMKACAPVCTKLNYISTSAGTSLSTLSWEINREQFFGNNFNYCFNLPGSFKITGQVSDTNNCVSTVTAVVTVYEKPKADFDFEPQQPIEKLDEIQFKNASKGGAKQFYWEFGKSVFNSTKMDPKFIFDDAGTYPVALVATNQWHCSDTIVKVITIYPDFAVYVPSSFTPNDDGINEVFIPVMRGAKDLNLTIYNRWGKLIFRSSDMNKGWDGTYNGEPCKEDVYIYKLIVHAQNDLISLEGQQTKNLTGEILLYR